MKEFMRKASELKDQSVEELRAIYHDLSREIFQLKNEARMTRKMETPHLVRDKKRDRARVLTVLRQKGASLTI
jgi:large subunit ribosomal protein L29